LNKERTKRKAPPLLKKEAIMRGKETGGSVYS